MLLFYIRHGDPVYNPDSLTPLGERQAEAVAKRLALYGIDRIFSSTSNRAIQTATPTAQILKKDITTLDFCNEDHAWGDFTVDTQTGKRWIFQVKEYRRLMCSPEVLALRDKWYTHPDFSDYHFENGLERIGKESDEFFRSLGYEHIKGTGTYKVINDNNKRVALFAHQGFGLAFLSSLLDIPYPVFATHFDTSHTGMTVIEFKNEDGISIPQILTLANDSHLYKEGLPTKYNNITSF